MKSIYAMLRKTDVILFGVFLIYSIILVFLIAYLYTVNWDGVFKKVHESLLISDAYKLMDDIRLEEIDPLNLDESDRKWLIRRANLYGMLILFTDQSRQTISIDTLSSFEPFQISKAQEFPYYNDGGLRGYLSVSTIGASYELNQIVIEYLGKMKIRSQIMFVILIIASICVSYILAKSLSKYTVLLTSHAERIRRGKRDVVIDVKGPEEIRQLAITLNEMTSELKQQEEYRQRMMEDIAHELRTPFTSMLTQLEAIIDGVYEPTSERHQEIYDELDRLSRLVNDLENISEAQSASFTLNVARTNMTQLARAVFHNFAPMAERKGINLNFQPTNVPSYGEVDSDKIVQVISNILSNAIKYTQPGGEVKLSLSWNEHSTIMICKDNGYGISEKDLPYIFNRLYRADKSRSRFSGGVGLGLSIVKMLVEAHNGQVSVESRIGKGSKFIIEIPNHYTRWNTN